MAPTMFFSGFLGLEDVVSCWILCFIKNICLTPPLAVITGTPVTTPPYVPFSTPYPMFPYAFFLDFTPVQPLVLLGMRPPELFFLY